MNPDFVKLAEAYGMLGIRVTEKNQVVPAIEQANETDGPVILDFMVQDEENVYPMIPSGQSVKELIELTQLKVDAKTIGSNKECEIKN